VTHTEKSFELAAKLQSARNDLKSILGPRYTATVKPYREVLRGLANESGKALVDVALTLAKNMDASGCDPSCVFAAFVDEVTNA
jgi:hypothetical protein